MNRDSSSPPPLEAVRCEDYGLSEDFPDRRSHTYPGRIELSQDIWTSSTSLEAHQCFALHVSGGSEGYMITVSLSSV